jgi:hypothetical protein
MDLLCGGNYAYEGSAHAGRDSRQRSVDSEAKPFRSTNVLSRTRGDITSGGEQRNGDSEWMKSF